ncbi:MAG: phosphatidylserine decarboxylase, partial [Candidatus Heimdallarchaeota archaeon]
RFILPPLLIGLIMLIFDKTIGFIIIGFTLYIIWFFRDPNRQITHDPSLIYAAADGKVIVVKQDKNGIKIGIRMSPFNVHINRSPIKGKINSIEHIPGPHHNVYFGDVENKNERNLIKIQGQDVMCQILQITGAVARRIECWVNESDSVHQGQKIGMIRLGSQTNMYIESELTDKSIKPLVNMGDKVFAGITAIAKIEELNNNE